MTMGTPCCRLLEELCHYTETLLCLCACCCQCNGRLKKWQHQADILPAGGAAGAHWQIRNNSFLRKGADKNQRRRPFNGSALQVPPLVANWLCPRTVGQWKVVMEAADFSLWAENWAVCTERLQRKSWSVPSIGWWFSGWVGWLVDEWVTGLVGNLFW